MQRVLFGWIAAIWGGWTIAAVGQQNEIFQPPVRLTVADVPIDCGAQWGHAGPCYEDVDGDGLRDLLVGDFSGKFQFYRNQGSDAEPQFELGMPLQAGGVDAEVRIY